MSKLEKWSKKCEKWFEKGKPLHFLYPLYDAVDSFLLTPADTTRQGSHIRDENDMKRTMFTILIALFPALIFGIWNIGYQHYLSLQESVSFWEQFFYGLKISLPIIVVTYVSGLSVEIIFAKIRNHQVAEGFFVTGLLIPLI